MKLTYESQQERNLSSEVPVIAKDSAPEPYTLTGTAIVEIMLADENDETPQINVMLLQSNSPHDSSPSSYYSFQSNKIKQNSDGAKLLREFTTTINENPQPETVIAYVQYDPSSSPTSLTSVSSTLTSTGSNSLLYPTKRNPLYENSLQRSLTNTVQNKQDYRLITGTRLTDLSSPYSCLDREVTPTQTITVTCTDSVDNSAYVMINVHLSDLNDNPPEFVNNGHFVFQIPENQELPGNKPIWLGRTIAVDNDQGVNSLLTYRLENDEHIINRYENKEYSITDSDNIPQIINNINHMFELNPQTGDLYVKTVFDRETAPNDGVYRLKVLCIDNGEPSLTGTAQVEVFILDENDWPPQFTREVYTFSVPENMRIHEIVGEVEAIDRDADSKGKITYQLVTHSYQPVNEISDWALSSSNQYTSRRLHSRAPENKSIVNDRISSAVENTESNSTSNGELTKDKQWNKTGKQSLEIMDELKKTTVSNLTNELSRNDIKPVKQINYSHSEKSLTLLNYFSVDRLTGKIRLIRALDRESVAFFTIEIVAIDSAPVSPIISLRQINSMMSTSKLNNGNNNFTFKNAYNTPVHKSLSSTATVVIAVTDINDNPPIFRRPNTSTAIQLSLHETLGRQLLTMEATDADEGENARITYQIRSEVPRPPGGSGTGHFAIDESSGMLFIARPLNNTTTHRFVVEACDGGAGSSKRCTLSPTIRINVFDGLNEPISNSNGDLLVYQTGTATNNDNFHQNHRQSDLSFDLDELTVGSVMAVQNGRRNEIVVVCLVVIFSILLMATILLVICLIHRRGLSARQWIVNRSENPTSDKQDCKKDQNTINKAVNRSNIDLWIENQTFHFLLVLHVYKQKWNREHLPLSCYRKSEK
ncbi:cadherin-related [Schistosoma mansoni]|uniref:cadherin-related n=1 Tax=Schistosoma mansoni TaxID=6183 RepID=UPI0001A629C8|nr:cadherin-related [Schistosoma mansoni]|eukprot:XP_018645989.1 cadherin-related [Schistosoma mansoni]